MADLAVTSGSDLLPTIASAPSREQYDDDADRKLIARIAIGDRDAFTTLYHRYTPRLGGYLWKMLRQQELVDEALNDTMLVVWEKAANFHYKSRLSSWLFGIAHNKGLKALEKAKRHGDVTINEENFDQYATTDTPQQQAIRSDMLRALVDALDTLSPEHRAVVELTFYEGLSYTEVANIVDCPVNTVKTRVFNARKQLTECLANQGLDTDSSEHLHVS